MMKKYISIFLKFLFFINIIYIILAAVVFRRLDIRLSFVRLEIGVLIISIILSFATYIMKLEKGNSVVNVILGYIIIIPSLFVIRNNFGTYLFRSAWLIYILMIVVGIIYGVVLYVLNKRYKEEVNHLNKLLDEKKKEE
jgi:phosphotransferase system  glucose/maltose/N-acetylglucosamine-specific IIC component